MAEEADADAATLRQQQARALLSSGQPLFVPVAVVVVALERVLHGAYGMASADIAAVFEDLLAVEGLTVDRAAAAAQALQTYRAGLDLVDTLHLAQSGLCSGLATFDARFVRAARQPGFEAAYAGALHMSKPS